MDFVQKLGARTKTIDGEHIGDLSPPSRSLSSAPFDELNIFSLTLLLGVASRSLVGAAITLVSTALIVILVFSELSVYLSKEVADSLELAPGTVCRPKP